MSNFDEEYAVQQEYDGPPPRQVSRLSQTLQLSPSLPDDVYTAISAVHTNLSQALRTRDMRLQEIEHRLAEAQGQVSYQDGRIIILEGNNRRLHTLVDHLTDTLSSMEQPLPLGLARGQQRAAAQAAPPLAPDPAFTRVMGDLAHAISAVNTIPHEPVENSKPITLQTLPPLLDSRHPENTINDGVSYEEWKQIVTLQLDASGFTPLLTADPPLDLDSADGRRYAQRNSRLFLALLTCVPATSKHQILHLSGEVDSSRQAWNLITRLWRRVGVTDFALLQAKLARLAPEPLTETMSGYFLRIHKRLWECTAFGYAYPKADLCRALFHSVTRVCDTWGQLEHLLPADSTAWTIAVLEGVLCKEVDRRRSHSYGRSSMQFAPFGFRPPKGHAHFITPPTLSPIKTQAPQAAGAPSRSPRGSRSPRSPHKTRSPRPSPKAGDTSSSPFARSDTPKAPSGTPSAYVPPKLKPAGRPPPSGLTCWYCREDGHAFYHCAACPTGWRHGMPDKFGQADGGGGQSGDRSPSSASSQGGLGWTPGPLLK